ncbi:hypothetical protein JCM5353_001253 [Sporobolomyces roseus]
MSCPDDLLTLSICSSRARPILILSSPFDKTPDGQSKLQALRAIVLSAFTTANRADVGFLLLLTQSTPTDFGYCGAFGRVLIKAFPDIFPDEGMLARMNHGSALIDLFRLRFEEGSSLDAKEVYGALQSLQTWTSSWSYSPIGEKLSHDLADFDNLSPMHQEIRNHLYNSDALYYIPPLMPENTGTSITSPFDPGTLRYETSLNDLRELAYDVVESQSSFSVAILCWIITGGTRHDIYENEFGVDLPILSGFCRMMLVTNEETFRAEMYYHRECLLSSTDHPEGNGYINWEIIAQVLRVVDMDRDGTEDDDLPFPPLIGKNASSNRKKKQKKKQARLKINAVESENGEEKREEEEGLVKGISELELEKRK